MSHLIIGLTGGIGSGKSTVADLFVAAGAGLVDTDAIAHELTAPGGAAIPALCAAFGPEILTPDGAMNRSAMRQRVFTDPTAKAELEALLHPLIRQHALTRCAAARTPYVILAVPLLVESGAYQNLCREIVTVDCPESTQIERVMARNGLAEAEVRRILAAQASRAERRAVAQHILDNSGPAEALPAQIQALHAHFLALAQAETLSPAPRARNATP